MAKNVWFSSEFTNVAHNYYMWGLAEKAIGDELSSNGSSFLYNKITKEEVDVPWEELLHKGFSNHVFSESDAQVLDPEGTAQHAVRGTIAGKKFDL
jgi:hypothetical protein